MTQQEAQQHIDTARERALKTPRHAARVVAGYYFYFTGTTLWEISHIPELSGEAKWLVREDKWNGAVLDPIYTFAECKLALANEE